MKRVIVTTIFLLLTICYTNAQTEKGTILIQTTTDIYRSTLKQEDIFKRFVIGFGGRYFVANKLAVGLGYDHAISQSQKSSTFYLASRFYLFGKTFVRIKPSFVKGTSTVTSTAREFNAYLFTFGLGHNFMLGEKWSLEPNVDYNININGGEAGYLSLKIGLSLFL